MFDDRTPLSKVQDMNGLTSAEAAKRLASEGPNELARDGRNFQRRQALHAFAFRTQGLATGRQDVQSRSAFE